MGGYTETILRMIDVMFVAMAQVSPERGLANAYGTINALSIAGLRTDPARRGERTGQREWGSDRPAKGWRGSRARVWP